LHFALFASKNDLSFLSVQQQAYPFIVPMIISVTVLSLIL